MTGRANMYLDMCTLHKPVQSPFPRFILLQNNLEDAGKIQAIWKPSALPFLPNVQGNRVTSGRVRFPVSNSRLTFCSGPSLSATQKPGLWGVEVRLRPRGSLSSPPLLCAARTRGSRDPAHGPAQGTSGLGGDAAWCSSTAGGSQAGDNGVGDLPSRPSFPSFGPRTLQVACRGVANAPGK